MADEPPSLSVPQLIAMLYLLVVVLGAINVPVIWAIGDSLFCWLWPNAPWFPRCGLAVILGLAGAATLYFEFRYEYPTVARFAWPAREL
jgi:hypothetical protein